METPRLESSDDSEVEELLSQLDDENLLELKLHSFRHGNGKFVTEEQSTGAGVLSKEVETRYEKLKVESRRHAEVVNDREKGVVTADEEDGKDASHVSRSDAECVKGFPGNDAVKTDLATGLMTSKSPPLSQQASSTTPATAAKISRERPSSSPTRVPSKTSTSSCFCFPPLKLSKKKSLSPKRAGSVATTTSTASKSKSKLSVYDDTKQAVQQKKDGEDGEEIEAELLNELEGLESKHEQDEWECTVDEDFLVDLDIKKTEKEFRRASKKERQLTKEAEKFVEWVTSTSARLNVSMADDDVEDDELRARQK